MKHNKKALNPEDLGLTDEDLARLSSMFSPADFVTDDKPRCHFTPEDFITDEEA